MKSEDQLVTTNGPAPVEEEVVKGQGPNQY